MSAAKAVCYVPPEEPVVVTHAEWRCSDGKAKVPVCLLRFASGCWAHSRDARSPCFVASLSEESSELLTCTPSTAGLDQKGLFFRQIPPLGSCITSENLHTAQTLSNTTLLSLFACTWLNTLSCAITATRGLPRCTHWGSSPAGFVVHARVKVIAIVWGLIVQILCSLVI